MNKIDKKSKFVWMLNWLVFVALLTVVTVLVYIFAINGKIKGDVVFLASSVSILSILFLGSLIIPTFSFKAWNYLIDEDKIVTENGVFFKNRDIIPVLRLQHIEIIASPFERVFGLASLRFNTAGSSHRIPCLQKEFANEILSQVKIKLDKKLLENKEG